MDWLNYHHLRYFWVVAKEGSLRAAADSLRVSQPSISAQLGQLEDFFGQPLFRRSGRGLQLTDTGRLVLEYAEDIFSTGRELLDAVRGAGGHRARVFHVGITDSLPKLVARAMLQPALDLNPAPRLICREGQFDELLPLLASHRLDLVLGDEPAGGAHRFKIFNHPLGSCGVTFCATGAIARKLRSGFPKSLHDAPALLPTEGSLLRRALEQWFHQHDVRPKVVGEFDDAALMLFFAREGAGFLPLHSVAVADARATFKLAEIGDAPSCRCHFHAITAERRMKDPAVLAITQHVQGAVLDRAAPKISAS
jgi:LysR family transcriptional regulator, transcriptional activator of nhaA